MADNTIYLAQFNPGVDVGFLNGFQLGTNITWLPEWDGVAGSKFSLFGEGGVMVGGVRSKSVQETGGCPDGEDADLYGECTPQTQEVYDWGWRRPLVARAGIISSRETDALGVTDLRLGGMGGWEDGGLLLAAVGEWSPDDSMVGLRAHLGGVVTGNERGIRVGVTVPFHFGDGIDVSEEPETPPPPPAPETPEGDGGVDADEDPSTDIAERMAAAAEVEDPQNKVDAYLDIAETDGIDPAKKAKCIEKAMEAAAEETDKYYKAEAYTWIAEVADGNKKTKCIEKAMEAAAEESEEYWQSRAYTKIAEVAEGGQKTECIDEAILAAEIIDDVEKKQAVLDLIAEIDGLSANQRNEIAVARGGVEEPEAPVAPPPVAPAEPVAPQPEPEPAPEPAPEASPVEPSEARPARPAAPPPPPASSGNADEEE